VKILRILPFLLCWVILSCKQHEPNENQNLTLEYYQEMVNPNYAINSKKVRRLMDSLMNNDSGSTVADLHTKRYYRNHGGFLWVDRHGIDHRADTLLTYLQKVDEMGQPRRTLDGSRSR
jgi:L,D-transpeptidase YcbB